ncbi:MAG: PLP-dependent aminotransferase family protein [Acetobacteraceae bacterium]|nr:PLP-dependent aminotransferase family protein [Acetobacteraceae bacterium]
MTGPAPLLAEHTRQQAVFERLRSGILNGTLPPGIRLPPTRSLAEELGVARQTVVLAYERLAAEGYVRSRVGSGTYVAPDLPDARPSPAAPPAGGSSRLSRRGTEIAATPVNAVAGLSRQAPGLLTPGIPAPELFPARAWAQSAARVLRAARPFEGGYPDGQGLPALRAQIAQHLAATRGLLADAGQIVVTSGTQQAIRIAAELLLDPGDLAWVEEPGYIAGRGAVLAAGARIVPVPSGAEGMEVQEGIRRAPDARLVLTAPSHATPLGGALPVGQRLALLDWAAKADAWVLEDDCDSEFRWAGKPLPPLATLDRAGRVIYCGTFSKTLAPGIRLGFAVMPTALTQAFIRARALMDRGPNTMLQEILAEFMRQGRLAPHIRRMRTEYARRRAAVLAALAAHCPSVRPVDAPGGLHLALHLPANADEAAVVRGARARSLTVAPLGSYYIKEPAPGPGLVIGFANTPVALAADAARRLNAALQEGSPAGS